VLNAPTTTTRVITEPHLCAHYDTLAQLVPSPGGGTAVASIGISGALIAFGVPKDIAVATALSNPVGSGIPAEPGWLATARLVRRGYL
jgi:hypothetical protein